MITADGYRAAEIIKNISLLDPSKRFIPGKTLLFFDEMQDFPNISTALKFFCIDGRFDVICSGSMLGLNYKQIESNSVGYKIDWEMTSMDFEEFLWAKGYGEDFICDMLDHMKKMVPFGEVQRSVYSALFMDFCILFFLGGGVRLCASISRREHSKDLWKCSASLSGIIRRMSVSMPMEWIRPAFLMCLIRSPAS